MAPYRAAITRSVLAFYLLSLLWRGYSHLLPGQLQQPVLSKLHYDLSFWAVRLSGIDGWLVQHTWAGSLFGWILITLCVLSMIFIRRRGYIIPFSMGFFLLAVVYNMYLCHSAHYLGGMVILSVAFWPRRDENFELLWDGMRYYACWVYGTAFLWKVAIGSMFQWEAGTLTFKANLAEYLLHNPDNTLAHIYYFFLQHQWLLNVGHKVVYLAEGAFLIGFFTRKYDTLLIVLAFFIFISIYLFSDVFFAELLVIIFPLIPAKGWQKLSGMIPFINRAATPAHQP